MYLFPVANKSGRRGGGGGRRKLFSIFFYFLYSHDKRQLHRLNNERPSQVYLLPVALTKSRDGGGGGGGREKIIFDICFSFFIEATSDNIIA